MIRVILLSFALIITGGIYAQSVDSLVIQLENGTVTSESMYFPEAKDPSTVDATRDYASENVERKKFDETKWRKIVGARNYSDTRTRKDPQQQKSQAGEPGQSNGQRGQDGEEDEDARYEYDSEEDSSINLSWLGPIGNILFYLAIAFIIGLILVQIIRNTSFKTNPKRPPGAANTAEDVHDISELDTDSLIDKAHNASDYKLAIRLYFLDLLKRLNENGMINWTKDKTNRDYLSELLSKQYYFDEVRKLTVAYERVWYGEHVPTEEGYQQLRSEFKAVSQKFRAS